VMYILILWLMGIAIEGVGGAAAALMRSHVVHMPFSRHLFQGTFFSREAPALLAMHGPSRPVELHHCRPTRLINSEQRPPPSVRCSKP
jgi:hypothetical protein